MDMARTILLVATVILFLIGAWPISIITITIFLTLTVVKNLEDKKKFQDMQTEIEQLKQQINDIKTTNREQPDNQP